MVTSSLAEMNCFGERKNRILLTRPPAPVQKSFHRREKNFVGEQTDRHDDEHDADHLFHRI